MFMYLLYEAISLWNCTRVLERDMSWQPWSVIK